MKNTGSGIWHRPISSLLPSTLQQFVMLLSALFTIEILVMQVLPYIVTNAPQTGLLEDATDAFMLTAVCAPFLWRLIIRPLRRVAMIQGERTETILQHVAEGVVCFDREGQIESFNPAAEEIFGFSAAELKKRDIMILFSKADTAETGFSVSTLVQFDAGKNSHVVKNLIGRRKNGGIFHMDLSVSELKLGGNTLFMGIMRDTAERKRSEKELSLAAKVFENMGEAIAVTDADNNYISVNPAFSRITGYTPEEVIGMNPRIMASGRHDAAYFQKMWDSIIEHGYWQGEIWDRRKNGDIFPKWLSIVTVKDKKGGILNYIAVFSDISERKAADERIHFMAHYDALTGLPNRVLLHDRILQAITAAPRLGRKVAILFLDLDRFKTINDTLGHSIGDLLLQSVAERLKECTRSTDTIARLGGDEFIVVIPDLLEGSYVTTVAQKILDLISTPFLVRDVELNTSASIGISLYPDDGISNEELIANADVAMYRSKESGRNNYQFFAPEMNDSAYERLTMENNLRRALERQEFVLYYQPQVNSETGRIIGAEALVRWKHPEMGLVPPGMFIPIAEESGLIVAIGEWVLREACRQNKAWQQEGLSPIPVAVNLSTAQFRQKNLTEVVAKVLKETGLEPCCLELEITESGIMHGGETAVNTLHSLKQMGLKLSIDDFGTGYSSLSYLKKFPLDKLKIDQSFVRDITTDLDDAAIVIAIIGMARSLKLRVIAEGVETSGHLDFLNTNGCIEIQGYYFGKPVPADEFGRLLSQGIWSEELCRDCAHRSTPLPEPDSIISEHLCSHCFY
ncbi:MAG TPA: EAL domain-containing protein [Dongiaceae bacterium]|nr:EAL domain-containing protein [Dongiaceae bacterium]